LILGTSAWSTEVRPRIAQAARRTGHVLISGPAGSGRATIARAIHERGRRALAPLVPISCETLPGRLFEAQLFGHSTDGFMPGISAALGCLRAAQGGTLLVRDIDQLELHNQLQLLEVLQTGKASPLGSDEQFAVDVRVIATVEDDLALQVAAGTFNRELYKLLTSVSIRTIPLQERLEDIEILAEHFLSQASRERNKPQKQLSDSALAWMRCYPWPGNVKQLQDVLETASALDEPVLGFEALRPLARTSGSELRSQQGLAHVARFQGFASLRRNHRCAKPAARVRTCRM
jgi:DNA-binding NtrC family response regulator